MSSPARYTPRRRVQGSPKTRRQIRYSALTRQDCKKWSRNKVRNPLTNRKIKEGARVFGKLSRLCEDIFANDLVVEGVTLTRGHAYGDGSCFFHSIGQLLIPDYTIEKGIALREDIANKLSPKQFQELTQYVPIEWEDDLEPEDPYVTFYQMLHNPQTWANESMIWFASKVLKVNIIIYNSESKRFVPSRQIQKRYPFIFLYNWDQGHFDPLFGDNGEQTFKWSEVKAIIQRLM